MDLVEGKMVVVKVLPNWKTSPASALLRLSRMNFPLRRPELSGEERPGTNIGPPRSLNVGSSGGSHGGEILVCRPGILWGILGCAV